MTRDEMRTAIREGSTSRAALDDAVDFAVALRALFQEDVPDDAWRDGADLLLKYGIHPLVQENDTDGDREA